jgi:hypothetical protein
MMRRHMSAAPLDVTPDIITSDLHLLVCHMPSEIFISNLHLCLVTRQTV